MSNLAEAVTADEAEGVGVKVGATSGEVTADEVVVAVVMGTEDEATATFVEVIAEAAAETAVTASTSPTPAPSQASVGRKTIITRYAITSSRLIISRTKMVLYRKAPSNPSLADTYEQHRSQCRIG